MSRDVTLRKEKSTVDVNLGTLSLSVALFSKDALLFAIPLQLLCDQRVYMMLVVFT